VSRQGPLPHHRQRRRVGGQQHQEHAAQVQACGGARGGGGGGQARLRRRLLQRDAALGAPLPHTGLVCHTGRVRSSSYLAQRSQDLAASRRHWPRPSSGRWRHWLPCLRCWRCGWGLHPPSRGWDHPAAGLHPSHSVLHRLCPRWRSGGARCRGWSAGACTATGRGRWRQGVALPAAAAAAAGSTLCCHSPTSSGRRAGIPPCRPRARGGGGGVEPVPGEPLWQGGSKACSRHACRGRGHDMHAAPPGSSAALLRPHLCARRSSWSQAASRLLMCSRVLV